MQRAIEVVGGVPTVTLRLACREDRRHAAVPTLVVIPGNPGVIDYYSVFMQGVYDSLDGAIDVVGIEHAGHSTSTQWSARSFGIVEQVQHKVAFVERERASRPESLLMIAGHSVGAYICLELLGQRSDLNILKSFMLLPTLHDIGATPNGAKLTPVFDPVPRSLVAGFGGLLGFLPLGLRARLVSAATGQQPEHARITAENLAGAGVIWNALKMANTEMQLIREVNRKALQDNVSRIVAFYGQVDGWVPTHHREALKASHPDVDVRECPSSILHAFVLNDDASRLLAGDVADVIKKSVDDHAKSVDAKVQLRQALERADSSLESLASSASGSDAGVLQAVGVAAPFVATLASFLL